jgi:hypothetical protein
VSSSVAGCAGLMTRGLAVAEAAAAAAFKSACSSDRWQEELMLVGHGTGGGSNSF